MKRISLLMLAVFYCGLSCAAAFAVSSREDVKMCAPGGAAGYTLETTPISVGFEAAGIVGGASDFSAFNTATLTVKLTLNCVPSAGQTVIWKIVSADNSANAAVVSSHQDKATGLAWGSSAADLPGYELTSASMSRTDDSGNASVQLTDIMGERTVKVQAQAIVGNTLHTVTQDVTFGKGPLAKFRLPSEGCVGTGDWDMAYAACNAVAYTERHISGWVGGAYMASENLPSRLELLAVSSGITYGAYQAAGWPTLSGFWTGEAHSAQFAFFVLVANGTLGHDPVVEKHYFVCRR